MMASAGCTLPTPRPRRPGDGAEQRPGGQHATSSVVLHRRDHHDVAERGDQRGAAGARHVEQHPIVDVVRQEPRRPRHHPRRGRDHGNLRQQLRGGVPPADHDHPLIPERLRRTGSRRCAADGPGNHRRQGQNDRSHVPVALMTASARHPPSLVSDKPVPVGILAANRPDPDTVVDRQPDPILIPGQVGDDVAGRWEPWAPRGHRPARQ